MTFRVLEEAQVLLMRAKNLLKAVNIDACERSLEGVAERLITAGETKIADYCAVLRSQLQERDTTRMDTSLQNVITSVNEAIAKRNSEAVADAPQVRSTRVYSCQFRNCKGFVPEDAKFCPQCGEHQVWHICSSCRAVYRGTSTYCTQCGVKLNAA